MIVLGVVAAGLGLLLILGRDLMWQLTDLGNQFAGRKSERTELWDAGQVISGVVLLLVAAWMFCVGIGENQQQAAESASATATASAATTALESAFRPHLGAWQRDVERGTVRVDPSSIGVDAAAIYYGRCASYGFFLYVVDFGGEYRTYAWVPGSRPRDCRPERTTILFDTPLGGGWYSVTHGGSLDDYHTPTPSPPTPTRSG